MWWRIHSGASQSKGPPWGSNLSIIYIVLWGRNRRALIGIGREESESMMLSTSSQLLKLFIHRCSPYAVHTWILPWILLGIWRVVGYIMSWNKSLYQLLSPKALRVLMWPSKAFFDHSTGLGTAQYILVWQGAALQANESESRSKSPWLLRTAMSFPFTYWQPIFRCSGDPWQNKVKGQLKLRR